VFLSARLEHKVHSLVITGLTVRNVPVVAIVKIRAATMLSGFMVTGKPAMT
jgi:hypothetical protein